MSYQRPQDPYMHSNASQYDEQYQQAYPQQGYQQQQGYAAQGAGYRDYPDHASGYQGSAYKESSEGLYGGQAAGYGAGAGAGAAGYGQSPNAASQAAATYSYAKPKKGISKWIKIVFRPSPRHCWCRRRWCSRHRHHNDNNNSSSGSSGSVGSGSSTPNVQGAALTGARPLLRPEATTCFSTRAPILTVTRLRL